MANLNATLYLCEPVTVCYPNGQETQQKGIEAATQMKTVPDIVESSGDSPPHQRKEKAWTPLAQ
jgi:hypothetical protein